MKRQIEFNKKVKLLEHAMKCELTTNIWHKHYSVYTTDETGCNIDRVVCAESESGAIAQISAIIDAICAMKRRNK